MSHAVDSLHPARVVIIRADGSNTIGMGHIMRCIGLAHELQKQGFAVTFALGVDSATVVGRLRHEKLEFELLGEGIATIGDATATSRLCSTKGACLLVIDGYAFDDAWLGSLEIGPAQTLLWTDYVQSPSLPVDMLLDQTPYASEIEYRLAAPTAKILCGLAYAVLRPEFIANSRLRRLRIEARHLLITMGGADPAGATLKALEALGQLPAPPASKVVIGPANKDRKKIIALASNLPGCTVYESVTDMSELLAWADLAISAAGTSLWEFAYTGLPALATSIADNQVPLAKALEEFGGGINLGNIADLSSQDLATILAAALVDSAALQKMSESMLSQVDGLGVQRVVEAVNEMLNLEN